MEQENNEKLLRAQAVAWARSGRLLEVLPSKEPAVELQVSTSSLVEGRHLEGARAVEEWLVDQATEAASQAV